MTLSKKQLKHLTSLAHHLKPVVTIGQQGLTENVLNELEIAINHHELIKIKIAAGDRDKKEAIIQKLCDDSDAQKVQAIGNTLTLFRRNPQRAVIDLS